MKGNDVVIGLLNSLLSDELTAVNQYMVHAEMCANWGYKKLQNISKMRAISEMKHAETLIERILFLEGFPIVSKYNKINIGNHISDQFDFDFTAEKNAIVAYNNAILVCTEVKDIGTAEMLEDILKDEEIHINDIETMMDMVDKMTMPIFLSQQV